MMKNKNVPKIRFKGFAGEWAPKYLGDCADIIGGGTPSTNISEYWDGDIDWYSPAEIGETVFVKGSRRKITKLGLNNSSATVLPIGTVLFSSRAGIGSVAILAKEGATNQGFQSIIPHENELNTYFIFSRSGELKQYGETNGGGSTFVEVSGKQMARMPFLVPKIDEQTQIGNYFQKIDTLINKTQSKLDKLKNIKKACLEKMFPKKGSTIPEIRFKGFSEEWELRRVKEIFKVTRGFVLAAPETSPIKTERNKYPVFSSQTKEDGLMGYYWDYLYSNAITWTTDGANAGTVNFRHGKFYCTNVCGVLLSDEGYANQMVAEALNKIAWKHVSKVGNPKLMNNVMSEIVIPLPKNIDEQNVISNIFLSLDNLITQNEQQLTKLKNIKKACLEKMFVNKENTL